MIGAFRWLALAIAVTTVTSAKAEDAPDLASKPRRSPLAAAAAIVPGVIVHGAGHYAGGDPQTGSRLLALEGAGLGTVALGFVPIVASGASRRLVGPGVLLTVGGVGLFVISSLADLYGVVAPPGGYGAPDVDPPRLETALGYRYVYDPVFAYRSFVAYDIDWRLGRVRLSPSAWFALHDNNSRLRLVSAYRLLGPRPDTSEPAPDGSYLEVATALARHAYTSNRFATTTVDLALSGRLDMQRFAASLTGSFAEMSFGWALQTYEYSIDGVRADIGELLLARFGYGIYLGWPGASRGEVMLYYDHRHDDFAAGLKLPGLASGVVGHFGADARIYWSDQWGMRLETAVGSAYVAGASLLFRYGAAR